jgi:hypothetical protein
VELDSNEEAMSKQDRNGVTVNRTPSRHEITDSGGLLEQIIFYTSYVLYSVESEEVSPSSHRKSRSQSQHKE